VDLILVLKDGAIVEQGTHAALVKVPGGIYRSLYEMQTGFGG
jgi:ATP-binding cassette subfamily B protein